MPIENAFSVIIVYRFMYTLPGYDEVFKYKYAIACV